MSRAVFVVVRPFAVVILGIGLPLLTLWLSGNLSLIDAVGKSAITTTSTKMEWREFLQLVLLIVGLPTAFLIWAFRDYNVHATLENQRKDVNLKAFQDVQLRAAGGLDVGIPEEARLQLQTAALHQLRSFLRGEYGSSFRGPALELILSGHAAAMRRVGVTTAQQEIFEAKEKADPADISSRIEEFRNQLSPIDLERMTIIKDEFDTLFGSDFKLKHRRFDLIDFAQNRFPRGICLDGCHFFGSILSWSSFDGAKLSECHFEGAMIFGSSFKDADLRWSVFVGANLHEANFASANLYRACLEAARLDAANFNDAHLRGSSLNQLTTMNHAQLNEKTMLGDSPTVTAWKKQTSEERKSTQEPWLARGAINTDSQIRTLN